jgi:predicted NBD/HSP70 family sugar kinase
LSDPELTATSSRRIRQSNEIAVLRALHRFGPLSRAELARKLRLNRSSSGHIIAGLVRAGLVRETAEGPERPASGRVGRPGVMFELVSDAVFFLGVEVGVEHISTVEIDLEARIVSRHAEPFAGSDVDAEDAIEQAVRLAFRSVDPGRLERCEGVGISIPAQMDRRGFVRLAPLLRWHDVDVPELAKRALPVPVPVLVENDANAFAIGATYGRNEARSGVTLFVVLESGVGGGIAIDGTLFLGAHGLAGEIGHLHVPDGAGMRALEDVIGLGSVLAAYGAGAGLDRPALADFLVAVRDREPGAVGIAEGWARTLAYALVQVCRIIDPDRIVLGGSLAALYPLVSARLGAYVRATQEPSFPIPAIATEDGECGSAFGAACMLHQRYLSLEGQRFVDSLPQREAALQAALPPRAG